MSSEELRVPLENNNTRIDKFLAQKLENMSRNHIQKMLETGNVTVNNKIINKNYVLKTGENIQIIFPEPEKLEIVAEKIELDIVYEDSDLIVINKPQNMVVHPAPGNYSGTLVNALLNHCKNSLSEINGVLRPGIVHRIDKNTSGLLVVAKNDIAHNFLAAQIKNHNFAREYEAIVHGKLKNSKNMIKTRIGRHKIDRKKMAVLPIGGREAITHYEILTEYKSFSHIKLKLETGRTHQIRVHMAYLGHPILGDDIYGGKKNEKQFSNLVGQCLHAKNLGFVHPSTNKYMYFESDLPKYFKNVINILEKDYK